MRLFDFIERLVKWESTTDEAIMGQARELIRIATNGNPPPLLDPFAGGGSIPLEAQRLGLEAHASDLNPVAVMINKAMIEIPPRFAGMPPVNPRDRDVGTAGDAKWKGAAGLAADVRYYGQWMRERAFEKIGHLYPTHNGETVIAWLWARTVKCPNPACQSTAPLVSSMHLSKKKGNRAWLVPRPDLQAKSVRFEVQRGDGRVPDPPKIGRGKFKCLCCDEPIALDHIKAEGRAGRLGSQPTAIVTQGKRGRNYHSATAEAEAIARSAQPEWKPMGSLPEQALGFTVQLYGVQEYSELFTSRQLVALTTFSDLVHEARELATLDARQVQWADDDVSLRDGGAGARAYGEAVSVYLAFAVDKSTDYYSSVARWHNSGEKISATFGRQVISMIWDYAEANPFSQSTGNWSAHINWIWKVLEFLPSGYIGLAEQEDAAQLARSAITLSTDPPYYDNIGYAHLSDYFYVWTRHMLRSIYPDIFGSMLTPKAQELIAEAARHPSKDDAKAFFERGMLGTFATIRRLVTKAYPLTVYYAFKQQDAGLLKDGASRNIASTGWETMLTSLIEAGFRIVGTWPMRTEGVSRLRAMSSNVLASSIVLVCRPRSEDAPATSRRRFLDALRAELPGAIAEMKTGSIAPVDMAQAAIGPGMAIYSRYSAVLEADGTPLTVRTALGLINAALDEALEEQDAELDAETRFAVGWFEERGFKDGDFGRANVLAQAKNTAVESVVLAGVVESGGGKVRLINWREYDPAAYDPRQDKRPTVWEGTHHLIERLNGRGGEAGAAELYNRLPDEIAAAARDLAYRLYHICERKGWAEDALDYNALVSSWSEITRLATGQRASGTQPELALDPD